MFLWERTESQKYHIINGHMQKEKRQEIQKSKEPGMKKEGTWVQWNPMVVAETLDQDQKVTLLGVGDKEVAMDLGVATMGMMKGLGVALCR
jgi:hypothetical protein